jgi:hypothetical protein
MKKFFFSFFLIIFLIFSLFLLTLSIIGIETNRFNSLISKKINKSNNNINLELTTIKFKLDIEEISLFIETNTPIINYRNVPISTKNIKLYIDFISLVKLDPKIKKINLTLNQLDIKQLKKLSISLKPSNFTSFLNNKVKQGKFDIELDIYLNKKNLLENFIARGSVVDLDVEILKDIQLEKTKFNFFADKSDALLKNIFGNIGPIKVKDGDLKVKLLPEISLETNFKSNLKYNKDTFSYLNLISDAGYFKDILKLEADLNNSFIINFDETYKVKKYNYTSNGQILNAVLDFKDPIESYFLQEKINKLSLNNSKIKINLNSNKNSTNISGKYSLNTGNFLPFSVDSTLAYDSLSLRLNADYDKFLELKLINYKKPKNTSANLTINLEKKKEKIEFKKFDYKEDSNQIFAEDIKFNKGKFTSFKKLVVKTKNNGRVNNDFSIMYGKKILINGNQFDASNLPKILSEETKKNKLPNINKDIVIDFNNIKAPLSENLKNFKLIGSIEKGKFTKISSKGDFGGNNFLDITMKEDKKNKKKYLEIYSDLTRPLLTEFSFFKGLSGGKLLYSSIIDGDNSTSKLKIENFNLINAPGMVKLLSLADLSGLADLAEGEGLSFDTLEINMEKNKDLLKLNEIVALGPSISVLMEGYQNPNITSLKGTLVPAKTLNSIISKIPVLGKIVIPKEVGEGLFGISFKMKGEAGKIKTSINPIKTITPRFIQKIIDKKKLNNFN